MEARAIADNGSKFQHGLFTALRDALSRVADIVAAGRVPVIRSPVPVVLQEQIEPTIEPASTPSPSRSGDVVSTQEALEELPVTESLDETLTLSVTEEELLATAALSQAASVTGFDADTIVLEEPQEDGPSLEIGRDRALEDEPSEQPQAVSSSMHINIIEPMVTTGARKPTRNRSHGDRANARAR